MTYSIGGRTLIGQIVKEIDSQWMQELANAADLKEYAVASSGHGSKYRFNYPLDQETLYTLGDALDEVERWRLHACTIGGCAIVIHIPSWKGSRKDLPFIDEVEHHLAEGDSISNYS